MSNYFCLGDIISPSEHTLVETKSFLRTLTKVEYATYIKSIKSYDWFSSLTGDSSYIEGIEFDINTSAFSKSNIHNTERVCVIFAKGKLPLVFALRKDFPKNSLHVFLSIEGFPAWLCLHEEHYSELRLRLTWELFLEDIHNWFKRASDGTAHLTHQALEPLIFYGKSLLVSNKYFDESKIFIIKTCRETLICDEFDKWENLTEDDAILIPIETNPIVSKYMYSAPQTLAELDKLAQKLGIGLRKKLSESTWNIELILNRSLTKGLQNSSQNTSLIDSEFKIFERRLHAFTGGLDRGSRKSLHETFQLIKKTAQEKKEELKEALFSCKPLIWFKLPRKRTEKGEFEWDENIGFLIPEMSLGQLCVEMGICIKEGKYYIHEKSAGDTFESLALSDNKTAISIIKPIPTLESNTAQRISGIKREAKKILAIGAGALGSQVIMNLTRMGIGTWDIMDYDILLPHNLSRHALFAEHARFPKAAILSKQLNLLMDDDEFSKPILCNFLEYENSIDEYDFLFDFSTSTAVLHNIAIRSERQSATSAFMTHKGKYLIYLSEGKQKAVRIDDVEYQLANACVNNKQLNLVLQYHDEKEIRYSGACGDVTTVLPQDLVAIHSGILTKYIKENIDNNTPQLFVWEITDKQEVKCYTIQLSKMISKKIEDWEVRISEKVLNAMSSLRGAKLPNETGGVLIGGFDLYNKIVYIVHIVSSPKDSTEEPYSYIRGCEELPKVIEKIKRYSGNRLNYVGEWHSHPNGIRLSKLDKIALDEQAKEMSKTGLPGVILVIGESDKYNIKLKQEWGEL